ncbi:TetR/AcrR family transcriptional regulator [Streptomyces sp. NPDC058374]|uniref:TetR/AcrR family transcriptional regulator n=1 Tax=unclassified Streptomyces TaxID=2593676 RepID=UPI0036508B81
MVKRGGPTLTERRAEELRMTIAHKAVEIFVADGDTSATVERIANAAGIATRTFYRHFAVKEDVVRPLFRHSSSLVIDTLRNAPEGGDTVGILVAAWTSAMDDGVLSPFDRRLLTLIAESPQYRLRWLEADDDLCEAVAEFLAKQLGREEHPLRVTLPAYLVVQATRHVFMQWVATGTDEEIADLLRVGLSMVLDGVTAGLPAGAARG